MSHWHLPDNNQSRNRDNPERRRLSSLGAVEEIEHATHFHRWLPALVLPFFLIAPPHNGHRRALFDFDRIPSCNRTASPYRPL